MVKKIIRPNAKRITNSDACGSVKYRLYHVLIKLNINFSPNYDYDTYEYINI